MREAIQLALEQMSLLESIGEPTSTIGAASAAAWILNEAGQSAETLRWARTSSSGQVGSRSYEIPRSGNRRSSHWRWSFEASFDGDSAMTSGGKTSMALLR